MPAFLPPLFAFIAHHRYGALFGVALFEGMGSTIAAGVFISLGELHFWPTLGTILVGDLLTDTTLYLIGRFGRIIARRLPFFKRDERRLETIERHYNRHPLRTLAIGKVSYGISGAFTVAAGGAKLPYGKFLPRVAALDAIKASLLLGLGWYFGKRALGFRRYLPYYALAIIVIVPTIFYIIHRRNKRKGI